MKHHYSPCFYTKKWAGKNGKIFYYSNRNGKVVCHDIAPQNTGYEIDLYAKENTPEDEKHSIEIGVYKVIDDKAAKIHQKIIADGLGVLTDLENSDWCRFLMSMMTRHAGIVFDAKTRGIEVIDRQSDALTLDQQFYHKDAIDYWRGNLAQETLAAMVTPGHKYEIGIFEKYNNTLLKMTWRVEDFDGTDLLLLTSDYPVTFFPCQENPQKFNTPNEMLLSGQYALALPLSPQKCFYACMRKTFSVPNRRKLIKTQNHLTVVNAKNFVYTYDRSQELFVQRRFGVKRVVR